MTPYNLHVLLMRQTTHQAATGRSHGRAIKRQTCHNTTPGGRASSRSGRGSTEPTWRVCQGDPTWASRGPPLKPLTFGSLDRNPLRCRLREGRTREGAGNGPRTCLITQPLQRQLRQCHCTPASKIGIFQRDRDHFPCILALISYPCGCYPIYLLSIMHFCLPGRLMPAAQLTFLAYYAFFGITTN
jgi:hypothetical protein